mmetsp:Transcript_25322/g.74357  ORF Transcript_25322/g.74357 Transcript_25322/m.74357 type:complete len:371 (-) Transcript_25322:132-1244(-)
MLDTALRPAKSSCSTRPGHRRRLVRVPIALLVSACTPSAVSATSMNSIYTEMDAIAARSFPHHRVEDGCIAIGHNLWQGRIRSSFPDGSIERCSTFGGRCAGFHVYVTPGMTLRTLFIEYKQDCFVLPQAYCPPLMGQEGGGRWYTFLDSNHCPKSLMDSVSTGACQDTSACVRLSRLTPAVRKRECATEEMILNCPVACEVCEPTLPRVNASEDGVLGLAGGRDVYNPVGGKPKVTARVVVLAVVVSLALTLASAACFAQRARAARLAAEAEATEDKRAVRLVVRREMDTVTAIWARPVEPEPDDTLLTPEALAKLEAEAAAAQATGASAASNAPASELQTGFGGIRWAQSPGSVTHTAPAGRPGPTMH